VKRRCSSRTSTRSRNRLFNTHAAPQLRKESVFALPGEESLNQVNALIDKPAAPGDFAVLVEGYGDRRLTLVVR
jgi:hypothetical protein